MSAIHSTSRTYLSVVNTLGTITQSHCYDQTSFEDCVEIEISHVFPLIAVDINELVYLCGRKKMVYRPYYSCESQSSKEVTDHIH